MLYKECDGLALSRLGFGAMRMPKKESGDSIDEAKAREMIEYAYEHGVNYFDTAYRYHNGESEPLVGKVLSQFPRETWYLATKMPGHMMAYRDGAFSFTSMLAGRPPMSPPEIFEDQLERCRVDYFDFYLLHNLCESAYGFYTDEEVGVLEYLLAQQRAGRIRRLGFSAHGDAETIQRYLEWAPDCFSFAQIQLNYLDWTLQNAKEKYGLLTRRGLPIIAMEPCRGGRLADLGPEANGMLKAARPWDSVAAWAFRFLTTLPGVQMALSGMSTMEQLRENIALFSREDPLTDRERALLAEAAASLLDSVPCTACRYCMEGCPQGLDIPRLLTLYNQSRHDGAFTMGFLMGAMKPEELPAACTRCGACAQICPQGINVPEHLERFAETMAKW